MSNEQTIEIVKKNFIFFCEQKGYEPIIIEVENGLESPLLTNPNQLGLCIGSLYGTHYGISRIKPESGMKRWIYQGDDAEELRNILYFSLRV